VPSRPGRGELVDHADVFALDLHRALVEQLPESLERLNAAPLSPPNLAALGGERGVYQLFDRGVPVYVGKSELPLATRLEQHRRRCSGRLNININDMSFRCLYVDSFVDAAAPERLLIQKYREAGLAPWNVDEGFAPRDVGRNRDHGRPGQWFIDRPVDYQTLVTVPEGGCDIPLLQALQSLKDAVPFDLFRFASPWSRNKSDKEDAEHDYPGRSATLPVGPAPVLTHVRAIIECLPPGWQATVLPQGLVIYKDNGPYHYALDGVRRTTTGVESVPRGGRLPPGP
jgi:hypothetical protein